MIAKKEWFKRRKYGGWGVSPKTWQGWVYVGAMIIPLIVFQSLPFWEDKLRLIVTGLWISFLLVDVLPIMFTVNRDELEAKIEAISERNAGWFMMLVLVAGIVYEIISSSIKGNLEINWFLAVALFGGALVKTISNIILEKRGVQ